MEPSTAGTGGPKEGGAPTLGILGLESTFLKKKFDCIIRYRHRGTVLYGQLCQILETNSIGKEKSTSRNSRAMCLDLPMFELPR